MPRPTTKKTKKKPSKKAAQSGLLKLAAKPSFAKAYVLVSVAVLLLTTCFWAVLGARIQQGNADQLANPYLFENGTTLHGAEFPGQHSFLLKWPLFWLMKGFGLSTTTFTAFTAGTVLLCVMILAFILYRIERRPLVFGTLCLALSSVLLMVPAQPYPGGILPVNMAMITTRNLEYVVFIVGLFLLTRSKRIRDKYFFGGVGLLGLLVASDKLFLTLGAGGALLAIIVYAIRRKWSLVSLMVDWLIAMLATALLASIILWLVQRSGVVHIGSSSTLSPYGLVHNAKGLIQGIVYALLGLATNFGANPIADYRLSSTVTHQIWRGLFSIGGIAIIVNLALLVGALYGAWRFAMDSLSRKTNRKSLKFNLPDSYNRLTLMLLWTSVAAGGVFVLSNHYYPVDSRYLGITLFAGFVTSASFLSKQPKLRPKLVLTSGACLMVAILCGISGAAHSYNDERAALAVVNLRNISVAEAVKNHPVNVLVGDYWRVLPARAASDNTINVMPLQNCTEPRQVLSSSSWQPDLANSSFAYLLSLDGNLTNSPHCSLEQVVASYGRPNASVLIDGTLSKPNEVLLFYDKGAHKSALSTPQTSEGSATVLPITFDELPYTSCSVPTVMNIVAHEDDDLLFMNPDTLHDIQAGHCVRTIYMTAGDGGSGQFYWLGRERGAEAAYAKMLGIDDVWVQRIVQLGDQQYITVANPKGNNKISLIFMHLPDGNMHGQGFDSTDHQNIERLQSDNLAQLQSVDNQSVYSKSQLTNALTGLMHVYAPSEIRTQSGFRGEQFPDHYDHMAAGLFAQNARGQYETQKYENRVIIPIVFYRGYPVRELPENLSGPDLDAKETAFSAYAKFDGAVCQSQEDCDHNPTYNGYLRRQYQDPI